MITRRTLNQLIASAAFLSAGSIRSPARAVAVKPAIPFLRGVNFSGLTSEVWNLPPPEAAAEYYLDQKKMNVVRLNFDWRFIQPQLYGPLDERNALLIDEQVRRITGRGAYIILELHDYGRRAVDGKEYIIGEHAALTSEHFADVWSRISERWKHHDKVIFELMNEPHDQRTDVLVRVSNDAIASIRATGATNLIMLCANGWNSIGWMPDSDTNNQTHMLNVKDPLDHFCFDVHHYFDDWSRGKTHNVRHDPIASMKEFTKWAKANGRRGFCGEFGCSINRLGLDACAQLIDHIESNQDVFLGWTWWGAGGAWKADYEFLLDPFARLDSAPGSSRDEISWRDPVDRPQMQILQHRIDGATPFNGWLISDALDDRAEAMYRHGDYQRKADGWKKCLVPENGVWFDSCKKRNNASTPSTNVQAVDDGGVAFRSAGDALTSVASLKQSTVYAIIAMQPGQAATNMVIATASTTPIAGISISELGIIDNEAIKQYELYDRQNVTCRDVEKASIAVNAKHYFKLVVGDVVSGRAEISVDFGASRDIDFNTGLDASLVIGASISGHRQFIGVIYDIVVVRGAVSAEESQRIEGRLFWDAGQSDRLPNDHPYRTRAPSVH